MRFELIFIRHGESCANVLLKQTSWAKQIAHKGYTDPELSQRGKALSEKKAEFMKGLLKFQNPQSPFTFEPNPLDPKPYPYTLGASALLRAQETAYLMVGKRTGLPIHVFPYIGETGFGGKAFVDNTPFNKDLQQSLLKIKYKDVNISKTFPSKLDARTGEPPAPPPSNSDGTDTEYAQPGFKAFLEWIPNHLDFFTKGNDGVYRAIIVSHSNFLKGQEEKDESVFPFSECLNPPTILPHKKKLDNNDFLVSIFELGPPEEPKDPVYLVPAAVYPKWHYFDTRPVNQRIQPICGKDEKCRKPVVISGECTQKGKSNMKTEDKKTTNPMYQNVEDIKTTNPMYQNVEDIKITNPMYQNAGKRKTRRHKYKRNRRLTLRLRQR